MNLKFTYLKSLIFIALFILSTTALNAQNKSTDVMNSSLKGQIAEKENQKPLEFATVSIYTLSDSTFVKGTITNKRGEFKLDKLKEDKYFLKVDFMGFQGIHGSTLFLKENQHKVISKPIYLQSDTKSISEVKVEGKRDFSRVELDKTVYNVSNSPVADGGSINDVLATIPKLSVNPEGEIQFRGSSNVKILIDGKISGVLGLNPADILRNMSAADVDRVELISSSSAKYDASGASGIINIIMKKEHTKGFNGNFSGTVGTKDKHGANASANLRTGKINLSGFYSYRNEWAARDYSVDRLIHSGSFLNSLKENADVDFGNRSHISKIGLDYLINDNNTLSLAVTNRMFKQNWNGFYIYDRANLLSSSFPEETSRESAVDIDMLSWVYNASFIHKFEKKGEELSVDVAYTDNSADNEGKYKDWDSDNNLTESNDFFNSDRKEAVVQIDYSHPVGKSASIETGYMYRSNEIDYNEPADMSTAFNYKEQIHGLYVQYNGKKGNLGYQFGVRSEYSDIQTNQAYNDEYLDFFPSMHLSYRLNDKKQVILSYSKMVYRPDSRMLNPFQNLKDPENQRLGSQDISAYYTHNGELSIAFKRDKANYKIGVFANYYNNLINQFRSVDSNGNAIVSYTNLNSKFTYGLEVEASAKFNKWWSFNGYVYSGYEKNSPNDELKFKSNDAYFLEGKVTSVMRIPNWFNFQASFRYQTNTPTAQGEYDNLYYVDLGFSRRILKKKASLSLNVYDLFDTFKFKINSGDTDFDQRELNGKETRIAKLTFRYFFGKKYRILKARTKQKRMRHYEMDI
ncbi:outer membrane beta-barrel family protein [Ancylomarina longa]|uniref:Outer membrane protein beta-barrel domain-containing protein n=1 Tax=Ancylomarina longa TaxID=2487017 RepID=A0A434AGW0_9BACT|nr:outer membrane beta-barrel family protein [Ancylomarina longa]RUT73628.1 hypothetical protein DLK05_12430 [Ancylomarina longa]